MLRRFPDLRIKRQTLGELKDVDAMKHTPHVSYPFGELSLSNPRSQNIHLHLLGYTYKRDLVGV